MTCEHTKVMPSFKDEDLQKISDVRTVRRLYPRFQGECPDCHENVILYSSMYHYVAGDW